MELLLWRHAQAEDHAPGLADADRALTPLGHKQAKRMGAWLDRHLSKSARILVSPARRAQETAQYLGRKFVTEPRIAFSAEPEEILLAAGWPDAGGQVLIVGHQPNLGIIAAALLAQREIGEDLWPIKKAALWWLKHRTRAAYSQTLLKAAIPVDLVA